MKAIRHIFLASTFLLGLTLSGQTNSPIRLVIGDSLQKSMTIEQIISKPFFKAYHPSGSSSSQYRITKLTLIVKPTTGEIKKYELKEIIFRSDNRTDPIKITAPKLDDVHLDLIKRLKPGDKINLHNPTILPPDGGATIIEDTQIIIR